jgi:chitodextrinase
MGMELHGVHTRQIRQCLVVVTFLFMLAGCGGSSDTGSDRDQTAPSRPTGLLATNVTESSITLNWSASTDNVATTGYRIFRDGTELETSATTSHADRGLSPDTQYQYTVSAYDGSGNESAQSSALSVSTAAESAGSCGTQTGTVVAIAFKYVMPKNVGKYVTLAATSTLAEYNVHSVHDASDINWSRRYKAYKYGNGGTAVTTWRLNTPPANGTLYEGTTALMQNDTIADPDDLFYEPNTDFVSGGSIYGGLAAFQDAIGMSENSAEGVVAAFVGPDIYDYRLDAGSALIDSVPASFLSTQPVLTDLSNDLGIGLIDIEGTSRPQGTDYETGAYSYVP